MSFRSSKFWKAYLKSTRPYYSFVTGIAGWAGIATVADGITWRLVAALVILFSAWGINQIINDYLGMAEDRINAPNRPMVSGEMNPNKALAVSIVLILAACVFTAFASWQALIPLVAGTLLNVAYQYAKGVALLGNIIFGIMIASAYYFGMTFLEPTLPIEDLLSRVNVAAFTGIAVSNGVMTYFTYFKDAVGDKAAGKHTLIVVWGIHKAAVWGWVAALLPFLVLPILLNAAYSPMVSWLLFAVAGIMALYTAYGYWRWPEGDHTYFNLAHNFSACVQFQVAVLGVFQPYVALALAAVSFVGVHFLFSLHDDPKS